MNAMEGKLLMADMSASDALMRYAGAEAMRGKTMQETLKKIMRYWVAFAMAKIDKGKSAKIRADLSAVVSAYSSVASSRTGQSSNLRTRRVKRAKAVDKWKGTLAAKVVGLLDYKNARGSGFAAYYAAVGKFVSASAFSANLLRAGFRPAYQVLKAMPGAGRMPKFKAGAGRIKLQLADSVADILVENWAHGNSPRSKGIAEIAPTAFSIAFREVEIKMTEFYLKDIKKAAKESGLTVDS